MLPSLMTRFLTYPETHILLSPYGTFSMLESIDSTKTSGPDGSKLPQTKRNRIQLSCIHCRHAKLKCDREKPCSQCVKRGRASICSFPAPNPRKRPAVSMQNRLKHLESLVKGVMTNQSPDDRSKTPSNSRTTASLSTDTQSQLPPTAYGAVNEHAAPIQTNDDQSSSYGQVVLGANETTYVGATHWAAILDNVSSPGFLPLIKSC